MRQTKVTVQRSFQQNNMAQNNVKESIGVNLKIKCFIDAGLQNQISRTSLVTILEEMASTHDGSKEVIKVLLEVLYYKSHYMEIKIINCCTGIKSINMDFKSKSIVMCKY